MRQVSEAPLAPTTVPSRLASAKPITFPKLSGGGPYIIGHYWPWVVFSDGKLAGPLLVLIGTVLWIVQTTLAGEGSEEKWVSALIIALIALGLIALRIRFWQSDRFVLDVGNGALLDETLERWFNPFTRVSSSSIGRASQTTGYNVSFPYFSIWGWLFSVGRLTLERIDEPIDLEGVLNPNLVRDLVRAWQNGEPRERLDALYQEWRESRSPLGEFLRGPVWQCRWALIMWFWDLQDTARAWRLLMSDQNVSLPRLLPSAFKFLLPLGLAIAIIWAAWGTELGLALFGQEIGFSERWLPLALLAVLYIWRAQRYGGRVSFAVARAGGERWTASDGGEIPVITEARPPAPTVQIHKTNGCPARGMERTLVPCQFPGCSELLGGALAGTEFPALTVRWKDWQTIVYFHERGERDLVFHWYRQRLWRELLELKGVRWPGESLV